MFLCSVRKKNICSPGDRLAGLQVEEGAVGDAAKVVIAHVGGRHYYTQHKLTTDNC
jgi:hypothetical protein